MRAVVEALARRASRHPAAANGDEPDVNGRMDGIGAGTAGPSPETAR
jgi:hypothetical protein